MSFSRPNILALCVFIAVLAAVTPLTAQESGTAEPPPTAVEEAKGPQPIPASQISLKAQETEAALKSMADRPDPDPAIVKISEDITATLNDLHELQEQTDNMLDGAFSVREIEDSERRWNREEERISGWQARIQKRAEELDRDLDLLQRGRKQWEITLEKANEAGMQDALVEVIQVELEAISRVEKRFGDRRAELLTIQEQAHQASEIIDGVLVAIEKAKSDASRFLASESPPLWKLLANLPPRARQVEEIKKVLTQGVKDTHFFVAGYEDQLLKAGLFFLLVLIMLMILNRRAGRPNETDTLEIQAAKHTLNRPVAASVVICLLVFAFAFRDRPRIIDDMWLVILIVPLFRLFPPEAMGLLRAPLAGLFALRTLAGLIAMLVYLSPLQRLASLFLTLVAIVFIVWILRKNAIRAVATAPVASSFLRAVAMIYVFLLVVAAIANTVGYFSIATVMASGVVSSAFVGVMLYVVRLIIASILWIGLGTPLAHKSRVLARHESLIRSRALLAVRFVLFFIWFRASLIMFQVWPVVYNAFRSFLTAEAKFGTVGISLIGVISLVMTIWAAFLLSRFIRFFLEEDVFPRMWLPRGVPYAISTSIHYVILTAGFFLAIAATGVDLDKFAILAGAFGVGLGFGLQNVVANFVSGLILIFERPIMTGDNVEVGPVSGVVKSIGMRSTVVRTWEGAEVIVPNGKLIAEDVTNWTLSDRRRRIDVLVGVAYGTDTTKVIELLEKTGAEHPEILEDPQPRALFLGFGESSLDFQLRCWTLNIDSRLTIMSQIKIAVEKAIRDAGIEIPFPQRDLHVRTVDSAVGDRFAGPGPAAPTQDR